MKIQTYLMNRGVGKLFFLIFLLSFSRGFASNDFLCENTGNQYQTGEPVETIRIKKSGHLCLEETNFKKESQNKHKAMYAGYSVKVNQALTEIAKKTTIDDKPVWRLKISNPPGQSAGFIFNNITPENKKSIIIYDENKNQLWASKQSIINPNRFNPNDLLSAPIMQAREYIIEYHPDSRNSNSIPELQEIIIIQNPFDKQDGIGNSGDCHVNINCPEGNAWQDQKKGIVRIVLREGEDWFWCSGSLVNNSREDSTPYLLTADHCGSEADEADFAVWQFYFNVESQDCEPGGEVPTHMFLTGAQLRARAPIQGGSDFKLLELFDTPPMDWDVYFNGWTLSAEHSKSGASIHHPVGDEKKISTYDTYITNATYEGGMTAAYWRVFWIATPSGHGVTQGGSSGAPLFNHQGLIIGTLTGGYSGCNNTDKQDYYGKFNKHWSSYGLEPDENLAFWLDPDDEGLFSMQGFPESETSISSEQTKDNFRIYPQPASEMVFIAYPFPQGEMIRLKIYNITGQLIQNRLITPPANNQPLLVSVESLQKGLYILELNNSLINHSGKLIIE